MITTRIAVALLLLSGVVEIGAGVTGGTDGRFLRGAGIPTYGASGVFIDESDYRAHGRDERIRVHAFYQGIEFYDRFIRALASQR